jgi:alkanesulfonate monooxygenase SsuD/methylene tetrahydromethanopterin reductase-like flavin-dependent oxidoreductase (luciferase family)
VTFFALRTKGQTVEAAMRDGFGNGAVISAATNVALLRERRAELGEEIADFGEASARSYMPVPGDPVLDHLEIFRTHANGVISPRHVDLTTELAAKYFCLWGDYDEIAERIQGMRDAGCDIPSVILANPFNYVRDMEQLAKVLYG